MAWSKDVRSGDADNLEARAAAYYWANLFPQVASFRRQRDGVPPNNLLNYGYAILRAVVARALVSSGMLPTLGLHHHNRYNAYCLADDIMEPYRPYVDNLVCEIVREQDDVSELTLDIKSRLLSIPVTKIIINGQRSPLMVGVGQTTASLYKCFCGELRKIVYPEISVWVQHPVLWNVLVNIALCGYWYFLTCLPRQRRKRRAMPIFARNSCATGLRCSSFLFICAIVPAVKMPRYIYVGSNSRCHPRVISVFYV